MASLAGRDSEMRSVKQRGFAQPRIPTYCSPGERGFANGEAWRGLDAPRLSNGRTESDQRKAAQQKTC